jgi:lipopolysaccharide/colanic/teichoic acid biosynthesis glycosyltransferase
MKPLPVSLSIASAIKLEDGGCVLYGQERWGQEGIFLDTKKLLNL